MTMVSAEVETSKERRVAWSVQPKHASNASPALLSVHAAMPALIRTMRPFWRGKRAGDAEDGRITISPSDL